jgi:aspartate racemase
VKRIGLLGGMSWESSAEYYRFVNEATRERLGGLHSADCILRSVDFAAIEPLQREGRWAEAGALLADEALALVNAGAELLVLCTNTMHKLADAITAAIDVPFVHIADTTAAAVRRRGLDTVGLLATAYTMEQDFYVGRLEDRHGIDVIVPGEADRRLVHRVIYEELCVGVVDDGSREEYRRIMRELAERGAQGILLGCTEIDLLVGPDDASVPVFDTTRLHAEHAVELALRGSIRSVRQPAQSAGRAVTSGAPGADFSSRRRACSSGRSSARACGCGCGWARLRRRARWPERRSAVARRTARPRPSRRCCPSCPACRRRA